MITKYKIFENKKNDWKLILDVSKIWSENIFNNTEYLQNFNEKYVNFLNSQKNNIIKHTSENSWQKLTELLTNLNNNKNNIKKSHSIWNNIYDWGDNNSVKISINDNDTSKKYDF